MRGYRGRARRCTCERADLPLPVGLPVGLPVADHCVEHIGASAGQADESEKDAAGIGAGCSIMASRLHERGRREPFVDGDGLLELTTEPIVRPSRPRSREMTRLGASHVSSAYGNCEVNPV